jgi:hypothetical protein
MLAYVTLHPPTNRPRDIPTNNIRSQNILSSVTIFYCDTSTMWHFSTVTFRLCDNFLLWHSDSKWTDCSSTPKSRRIVTLTFRPTVILANPWLWHFVHFGFWFLPLIPCQSYSWFWQMTLSWRYPFNFFVSTHQFRRPRSDQEGVFTGSIFSIIFPIRLLI